MEAQSNGGEGLPKEGYVRQRQLIPAIIPVSAATLWRWIAAGKFPRPVRLGPGVSVWPVEAVRQWIAERNDEAIR